MSTKNNFVSLPQKKIFSVCRCEKVFHTKGPYYAHVKKCSGVPSFKSETVQPVDLSSHDQNEVPKKDVFKICLCDKQFHSKSPYYAHVKKCPVFLSVEGETPQLEDHSSHDQNVILKKNVFKTCVCEKEFNTRYSYYVHIKKCSAAERGKPAGNFNCLEEGCSFSAIISDDFLQHLKEIHNKQINEEVKSFQNYSDFKNWLQIFEKEERSSFIRQNTNSSQSKKTEYYYCNRGGKYLSRSTGKRCQRSQGSRKIGFNCPASIRAVVDTDSLLVKVKIKSLHYGHDLDLCHINISKRLFSGLFQ